MFNVDEIQGVKELSARVVRDSKRKGLYILYRVHTCQV